MFKYKTSMAFLIFFCVVLVFFNRLFYPHLGVFVTPDFGRSDLFQLNYPAKFSLSQALQNNVLPIWNSLIGTGFPQLAEGQIGVFNMINLVLYKALPFEWAYNLAYLIIFMVTLLGTYLYLRLLKQSWTVSTFVAIIFAFSGPFITHISHVNLLHAASYIPWLFLVMHLYVQTRRVRYILFFSLLLSQQLFAGFPQISFIAICALACMYVCLMWNQRKFIYVWVTPVIALSIAVLLAMPQLLPSREFLDISTRKDGFSFAEATRFSFPWKHLSTIAVAELLGSPKDGSYPPFYDFDGSVFWENTGFIGILPVLLALTALYTMRRLYIVRSYAILLVVSLLLMTGKYSPLYFIFTFPPFNYFRVPSRYIFVLVWALCVLAGIALGGLKQYISGIPRLKPYATHFIMLIFIASCIQLFAFSYSYNPIGDANTWFAEPAVSKHINNKERFYVHDDGIRWNSYFVNEGWQNMQPFLDMQNFLRPNANLLYSKNSAQVYQILLSNRYDLTHDVLTQNILKHGDKEYMLSTTAEKLLAMQSVTTILSMDTFPTLTEAQRISSSVGDFIIYKTPYHLPRAHVVYDYKVASSVEDFIRNVQSNDYDPTKQVLLEEKIPFITKQASGSAQIVKDSNTYLELKTTSSEDGILVLSDLYYPGWHAYVDGRETTIYPANGMQRAVLIPRGNHDVVFTYEPLPLKIGLLVSGITHVVIGFLIVFDFYLQRSRKETSMF